MKKSPEFVLPPSVISLTDVAQLILELERVDNALTEAAVKTKVGASLDTEPTVSKPLSDFLVSNKLSLKDSTERSDLIKRLRSSKDQLPVIHMTFASEIDGESLVRLADWARTSVHPQAVIEVGLQPDLIAGVYLRTPTHVRDFSGRSLLLKGHDMLVDQLKELG